MADDVLDDATISNEAVLWRRIRRDQLVMDDNLGCIRPSSSAFNNSSDGSGMSVIIGGQVLAEGRTADSTLVRYPGHFMTGLSAALIRDNSQGVVRKPLDDEPAHAEVTGKKTGKVKSSFARNSIWVVPPPADIAGL